MPFFSRSDRPDRPTRRRDDRDHGRPLLFEVDSFEFVPAGDGLGLLRLSGAFSADPERVVAMPIEIEIERDGEAVRLPVLPDPSAPLAVAVPAGEAWRGAFMAESELAEDVRSDFALVAGGEVVAGLPRPGDYTIDQGYVDAADEDAEPEDLSDVLAELERDAGMENDLDAVRPLEIEAHDVAAEHVAAREVAEERAEAAESTAALLRHEVETLRADVERERARHQAAESELRGELEEARRELEATTADDSLERKLRAMHEHLEQARGELEIERRRSSTMEEDLRMTGMLERQLRDALAGREAELAQSQEARPAREVERSRDPDERGGVRQSHEVQDDFFARIEQAKRLSESAG
jgi:hypothetical protein